MPIKRMPDGRSMQFGSTTFSETMIEQRLLPDPTTQVGQAISAVLPAAVGAEIANDLPAITAAAQQTASAAIVAATPGIVSAAQAAAQAVETAALPAITQSAVTAAQSAVSAALPGILQSASDAATAAVASAIAKLPSATGGIYTVTPADAASTSALIATGLGIVTTAVAQLYDSNNILLAPSLTFSIVGTSIRVAKNGLLWAPVAGQKINWIAIGKPTGGPP